MSLSDQIKEIAHALRTTNLLRGRQLLDIASRVAEMERRLAGYEAQERGINEALNSGDGSYRP